MPMDCSAAGYSQISADLSVDSKASQPIARMEQTNSLEITTYPFAGLILQVQ